MVSESRPVTTANGFSETTSLSYDAFGRVNRKTLSSGQYEQYTYDALHRVSQIALKNSVKVVLRNWAVVTDTVLNGSSGKFTPAVF